MIAPDTTTRTAYTVRDKDGRLVLAFWGASAADEATAWVDRGYTVEQTDLPRVD